MFTHDCTMEMQARELGADMLITKDFTLAAVATALL
jgi:hypothetical protein